MKRSSLNFSLLAVATAFALAGCKTRNPSVTEIPPPPPPKIIHEVPNPRPSGPRPSEFESNAANPDGKNIGNREQPGREGTGPDNKTGTILAQNPGTNMVTDTTIFQADTVYFDFDRSNVKKSEKAKVDQVASYLKDPTHSSCHILIEGHCDERGTEDYNLALGDRRALSLRAALIEDGVSGDIIHTVSYGLTRPAVPGHNEEAWSKNRRGMFDLLTPGTSSQ
jgi:peptidoglycan-associated lipoprotein